MAKLRKYRILPGTVKGGKGGALHLPGAVVLDAAGNERPGVEVAMPGDVIETDLKLEKSAFASRVELIPESKKVKVTGPTGEFGAALDPNFPTTPPEPSAADEHNDDPEDFEDDEKEVRRQKALAEDDEPVEEEDEESHDDEADAESEDEEEAVPRKKVGKKAKKKR